MIMNMTSIPNNAIILNGIIHDFVEDDPTDRNPCIHCSLQSVCNEEEMLCVAIFSKPDHHFEIIYGKTQAVHEALIGE